MISKVIKFKNTFSKLDRLEKVHWMVLISTLMAGFADNLWLHVSFLIMQGFIIILLIRRLKLDSAYRQYVFQLRSLRISSIRFSLDTVIHDDMLSIKEFGLWKFPITTKILYLLRIKISQWNG